MVQTMDDQRGLTWCASAERGREGSGIDQKRICASSHGRRPHVQQDQCDMKSSGSSMIYESYIRSLVKMSSFGKGFTSGERTGVIAEEARSSSCTSSALSLSLAAARSLLACEIVLAPGMTAAPLARHQAIATSAGVAPP
eukprot:scaffold29315_cov35-Tisochrysis_lutea.AAC.1